MSAEPRNVPLPWVTNEHDRGVRADTPFGSYHVSPFGNQKASPKWEWGYRFDEYYDEEDWPCESLEAGKAAAQAHWNARVAPIIDAFLSASGEAA